MKRYITNGLLKCCIYFLKFFCLNIFLMLLEIRKICVLLRLFTSETFNIVKVQQFCPLSHEIIAEGNIKAKFEAKRKCCL